VNWEAIGAIGEAFSAVALVLVLIQVRHAREEMRRSLHETRGETVRRLHLARALDSELVSLGIRAEESLGYAPAVDGFTAQLIARSGLTRADASRLFSEQMAWWSYRQQVIPHLHELDAGARFEIEGTFRTMYGPRGSAVARLWYETTKPFLDPNAVQYVERVLTQSA
jgi:hypothetical protein